MLVISNFLLIISIPLVILRGTEENASVRDVHLLFHYLDQI